MFEDLTGFRHEHKYIEPEINLTAVEKRLGAVMKKDPHLADSTGYTVRSLYFDDYDSKYLYENINGVDEREKWRIRIYNGSSSHISLERKIRKMDLIKKQHCDIDTDTFKQIMDRTIAVAQDNHPVLNMFIKEMKMHLLHPAVIVEYDRMPFICPEGNVRVTIDRNIRSSADIDAFLEEKLPSFRSVLPKGQNLIEVKFDAFLPDYIRHTIEHGRMRRETFSKYYLTRKFPYDGIRSVHYQ